MTAPVLASAVATVGALLIVAGTVGVVRFPDTLSRMHAAGVASAAGLLLVLLGASIGNPSLRPVVAAAAVLQLFASPVGAHVVGRAVHREEQRRAASRQQPPTR